MDSEETKKTLIWNAYLLYLKDWIVGHLDSVHYGSSPVCFDEWFDNEGKETL